MIDFQVFKKAVAAQFKKMSDTDLYVVDVEKDALWTTYLGSFPAGTNPMYKERTEHDCNCCKSFIRAVGAAVAVIDGKVQSIWDVKIPQEPAYQAVADALAALVKSKPITDVFMHFEKNAGVDKNFQQIVGGTPVQWDHFFVNIPPRFVCAGDLIASRIAVPRDSKNVLRRALEEIDNGTVETVLDLIAQNSLYRGEEQKFAVVEFGKLAAEFAKLSPAQKDIFVWQKALTVPQSISRIRNTAIGTLLTDIATGVDLEHAVKSFETKVAPSNYKRPTALVTQKMIDAAKKTIEELGLTSALQRRYAVLSDISVNNVIFADRSAKKKMAGDVFDTLKATKTTRVYDEVEEISIDKFISDVVPRAEQIEIMFDSQHSGNLVTLIAPNDPTSARLFKWDNGFSWSYVGDVADSIKERVKAAGGSVEGDLCCRLAWDYSDDLDFIMNEPTGHKIYFGAYRRSPSPNGGMLDLDANGFDGIVPAPAENIYYKTKKHMAEGTYVLSVNNYSRRSSGEDFTVEIEHEGTIHRLHYAGSLPSGKTVKVAEVTYSKKDGFSVKSCIPSAKTSKEVWGVKTNEFQRVNVLMHSPNHWDEQGVGNRHYMFMLADCAGEESARGFYNEFLREDLTPHRKVMEMVGSKLPVAPASEQLSGLGFSSTKRESVICRVTGATTRVMKINF